MIDDDDYTEEDEESTETSLDLGHWVQEHYLGDPRFETVELFEPGPLEGEDFRVRLIVNEESHFFVSVLPEEAIVRVGLSTDNEGINDAVEQAILDSGESLTEFLEDAMASGEELEFEMQNFHDDAYYFCSDIPYDSDAQLKSLPLRDTVIYYLDGYIDALLDFLELED